MNLPLFYRHPVTLNTEQHADIKVSPSPYGYRFAATTHSVMLATIEFFDAGREFPIIFSAMGDGQVLPLALLGLQEGENLFVGDDGSWLGRYIPAYIRRYPFITTDGSDGNMTVCFDEAFDGYDLEGGLPLFENGAPTPKLEEIRMFLQDYFTRIKQTEQFCAMLAQAGLLRQIEAQVGLKDGRNYSLNGMLVVDEQKLAQLPDIDIVRLFRSGMLASIHAHLLSLRNLGLLTDMKAAR